MRENIVSLIHIGNIPASESWKMTSDGHPFEEIIVVMKGKIRATVNGTSTEGGEGDVLYYPRGIAHHESAHSADPCETIFFAFTAADGVLTGLPTKAHDRNGIIRSLANWAYRYRRMPIQIQGGSDLPLSFFRCILAEFRHLSGEPSSPLVDRTREFVLGRLKETIRLDDLSSRAGLSKYHFSRVYKQQCGRSPIEDLTLLRLEHARNLILTTDLPMARVAEEVGFSDAYHISHLFRKHLNIAPSELRASARLPAKET